MSVEELLQWLGEVPTAGSYDGLISGISDLRKAGKGEMTFLSGGKYLKHLGQTEASVVVLPAGHTGEPPANQLWVFTDNPSLALATVCERLQERIISRPSPGIHPTALVDPSAKIPASTSVGPYCVIGRDVVLGESVILGSHVCIEEGACIGDRTHLHPGVVIGWGCRVGADCLLFGGVVIGADGFGFHSDKSGHRRLPQIGIVVIEDEVEVGANSTVDRARFSETRIGQGTKIDNLVQVGHNVTIGKHCILCSQSGIAGSATIGDFVVLAGQVGVNGHISVGDGVMATGQTGISKDVPAGAVLSGTPGRFRRDELKRQAQISRLGGLLERVRKLEEAAGNS